MRITKSQHNQIKSAIAAKGMSIIGFARLNCLDPFRFQQWLFGREYLRLGLGERFISTVKDQLGIDLKEA